MRVRLKTIKLQMLKIKTKNKPNSKNAHKIVSKKKTFARIPVRRNKTNRGKINGIVTDFNTFTSNISRNDQKIDSVINNLDKISTKLAGEEVSQAITNVSSAIQHLDSVLALMENGTGTLGKLSTNDSLYNNLKNSLESLDLLLKDLKANPKKYINVTVFGKKEKSVAKKED